MSSKSRSEIEEEEEERSREDEDEDEEEEKPKKKGKKKKGKFEAFHKRHKEILKTWPKILALAKKFSSIPADGETVRITSDGGKKTNKTFTKRNADDLFKDFKNQISILDKDLKAGKKPKGGKKRQGFNKHYRFLGDALYKFFTDKKLKDAFTINGEYLLDMTPELVEHRLTNDSIVRDLIRAYTTNRQLYKLADVNKGVKKVDKMNKSRIAPDEDMRKYLGGLLEEIRLQRKADKKANKNPDKTVNTFEIDNFNPITTSGAISSKGSVPEDDLTKDQLAILKSLKSKNDKEVDKDLVSELETETADVNKLVKSIAPAKGKKKGSEKPKKRMTKKSDEDEDED